MSAESLNTCTLSGNLGNDAEVRYTAGGMAITLFSLAVNHRRKQQDGSYADETSWVDCTIFGKRGESLQANGYLQKGAKLAVVGHLRMSTWEADGQCRRKLALPAAPPPPTPTSSPPHHPQAQQQAYVPDVYDEDIPF